MRKEGLLKAKAMNALNAGRDRASPASVRHDAEEPLIPISPCYCTRKGDLSFRSRIFRI
jgi:hypothetical protein